ncbi:hypothetical protein GS682_08605 [Nostoc sp. B(2019)]|nr:hypothetical protein [Nostoc sp. B(2019)]
MSSPIEQSKLREHPSLAKTSSPSDRIATCPKFNQRTDAMGVVSFGVARRNKATGYILMQ